MSPMAAGLLNSTIPPPDHQAATNRQAFRRFLAAHPRPAVRSIYLPDSSAASPFHGALGSSRSDWQTTCAILASKAAFYSSSSAGDTAGAASSDSSKLDHHLVSTVNRQLNPSSASLDLVPVTNLPRPLSICDLSPPPKHGSSLRVAYQGVPGAYSEAAAGKAYPNCEPIPCDQFEMKTLAEEPNIVKNVLMERRTTRSWGKVWREKKPMELPYIEEKMKTVERSESGNKEKHGEVSMQLSQMEFIADRLEGNKSNKNSVEKMQGEKNLEMLATELIKSFKQILQNKNALEDFIEEGIEPENSRIMEGKQLKGRRGVYSGKGLFNVPIDYKNIKLKKRKYTVDTCAENTKDDSSGGMLDLSDILNSQ